MAAASVAVVAPAVPPGNKRRAVIKFTPSTSYPALGEPITAANFGMTTLDYWFPLCPASVTTIVIPVADQTNNKLRFYTGSTGAEVGTGSDQSLQIVYLIAQGI